MTVESLRSAELRPAGTGSRDALPLTRFIRLVNRLALVVCGTAIALMALHIVSDVVARNLLSVNLPDTTSFVGYLWMPIIAYLGLGAAQIAQEHMTVSLLVDHSGPRTRRVVQIVADVVVALLMLWMGVLAFEGARHAMELDQRVGLTRWLVLWPIKAVVGLGMSLYFLSTVATLLERILRRTTYADTLEGTHVEPNRDA